MGLEYVSKPSPRRYPVGWSHRQNSTSLSLPGLPKAFQGDRIGETPQALPQVPRIHIQARSEETRAYL